MFWKKNKLGTSVLGSVKNNVEINTDSEKIEEILNRGISEIYPTKDDLKKVLSSGRRLRIYVGADATGKSLHLGHSKNFILLEKLRRLGHEVVILFGDFTAMIGDPTDKTSARIMLSEDQINENLKTWKDQISKIVKINDSKNPVKIVRNNDWLSKLNFKDVIDLSANFTVGQMIERDMFQKRIQDDKPIYMHEFFYPLMQGYDSVVLDVDLEIGGTDQTFNMLTGRTLLKKFRNKEKFVITNSLIEDSKTGKKMSKSEGNYVALDASAEDMFGQIMALSDEFIVPLFTDATFLEISEVEKIRTDLESGELNPRDAKVLLGKIIVSLYHSIKEADKVAENFEKTFSKGEVPTDVTKVSVNKDSLLSDVLLENKIINSKAEWRRLIEQGGVSIIESGEKITDPYYKIDSSDQTYRIGKKRFIKIVIK
jgi:tyrosyl-tRNA synthetase